MCVHTNACMLSLSHTHTHTHTHTHIVWEIPTSGSHVTELCPGGRSWEGQECASSLGKHEVNSLVSQLWDSKGKPGRRPVLRKPWHGSLRKCGKVGPLLRVPLVFTCDWKGLLFLCPCQSWSTISCEGDPVDEDSLPTRDPSVSQGFNEPFLVLGPWLGGLWPWNRMEMGHVAPRRPLEATVLLIIRNRSEGAFGLWGTFSPT